MQFREGENGAHSINRDPKLARLPMPSPINRMQYREGENGAHSINRDSKLARLPMGPLTGSISAPLDDFCL